MNRENAKGPQESEQLKSRAMLILVGLGMFVCPVGLHAQGFAPRVPEAGKLGLPKGFLPPAGMCRVWIDNVPAGKQPPPTDCATAIRNRPSNGRVIFGDDMRAKSPAKADSKGNTKTESRPKKP